ncbi:DNA polymerase III subunit alpha [Flavobacterium sp.]|uniref:DNA polymerase III subunit alpha n=1 Tax=Flavobacterium sp. TaxID=239 RepID=UPI0011F7106A|nr:DNA polymerase III subunit alpha [Flavobacterium sp.]RZJ71761.1 MAG: DNA polymerase III subunit alpha [Flavobacterium sp.]
MYLNCHSYHSLRHGTIPIEGLVEMALKYDIPALALTDINTVTGIYDFVKLCEKAGIKPLVGIEFRVGGKLLFIGLAKNANGIAEMNRHLSQHNLEKVPVPEHAPEFQDTVIIYPVQNVPKNLREFEYIGIRANQLSLLYSWKWKKVRDKMVALNPVTIRSKQEYNLHRILRAIDSNVILTKMGKDDLADESEKMVSYDQICDAFSEHRDIVSRTLSIIDQCDYAFNFTSPKNKKHFTQNQQTDLELLTRLAFEGKQRRYGVDNADAITRVNKELKVIDDLGFSGYFLITWDIIEYSKSRGFMHVGRGSGANSIVSYCLGITDICPIELDLYFERFLNSSRKSPPDFDIDWSWQERDFILEYIFTKYGRDHVAFCGTNVEFKYRSIFRELGKVFGLPKEEIDKLAKSPISKHDDSELVKLIHKYGQLLEKFPNQRSMHSCGILISEEPITNYTALEMPPKGFPIVQFDMHVAEDIGFEKFDILSQRGLGTINDTVKLIEKNRGIKVDISDVALFKNEPTANEWLSRGKTIGCFYIESPAMRGLLRRLKCENYKVLVAASSIIRPGVAMSGMMREYIIRHNHPNEFEYFHPVFEQQLGETYGVMVYQEDVIKIALHYAGLEPAYGDILRRAISGKQRSMKELQIVKGRFFECCAERGHPLQLSQEVYRQIESFAGYSFCKAHSASYAVESYQSLYLKVYYGIEFMTAAINNGGGFYRTEVYIHEARMSGAEVKIPCVNRSLVQTTVYGRVIYLGFMHLKSLDAKTANVIVCERESNGDFASLEDFVKRVPIGIETLQLLIFIGAFNFTKNSKNELALTARLLLGTEPPTSKSLTLLEEPVKEFNLPQLSRSKFEDAFDEIELLDFPVSCSPFDILKTKYRGDVMTKDLLLHHKKQVKMLAYLISRKQVPTARGDMYFGTWIDVEGEYFDTAHFADCLQKFPFQGGGCYLLLGMVEVDFHFPTITVTKMAKMPFIADPRYTHDHKLQYKTQSQIREDLSLTERAPYPQEHQIGLPRYRMQPNNSAQKT